MGVMNIELFALCVDFVTDGVAEDLRLDAVALFEIPAGVLLVDLRAERGCGVVRDDSERGLGCVVSRLWGWLASCPNVKPKFAFFISRALVNCQRLAATIVHRMLCIPGATLAHQALLFTV